MDRAVIESKVESLRRCVWRIETKRPEQLDLLQRDWDLQDIITLNLTRAVQLCVDIAMHLVAEGNEPVPDTMAGSFDRLREMDVLSGDLVERLKGAVGFRNVAVHNYRELDWGIVHTISHRHLDDFRRFAEAVMKYIDDARAR